MSEPATAPAFIGMDLAKPGSEFTTRYHLCMDVAGKIRSLGPRPRGSRYVELKYYQLELAKGRRVVPLCKPAECPDFDYQNGCPGHRMTAP